ncbi:hypothetical protein AV530_011540 [Patagioenas fasciata monilis]|uniref:Nucleolar protein 6 n=1 Tax=Patagioenas fasciata monilis TaxID=372326 RepID=A0A1V4JKC1_PATFA|nr:hypothetical protein AV530_011540 [Patagioenas fasciata monilis]
MRHLWTEKLLKEVTLKETKKKIDAFLHEIKNLLSAIPEAPETELTNQAWLPKGGKVLFSMKERFYFLPLAKLKVMGSYLLGTCIKLEINMDVAVTMPQVSHRLTESQNVRDRK